MVPGTIYLSICLCWV